MTSPQEFQKEGAVLQDFRFLIRSFYFPTAFEGLKNVWTPPGCTFPGTNALNTFDIELQAICQFLEGSLLSFHKFAATSSSLVDSTHMELYEAQSRSVGLLLSLEDGSNILSTFPEDVWTPCGTDYLDPTAYPCDTFEPCKAGDKFNGVFKTHSSCMRTIFEPEELLKRTGSSQKEGPYNETYVKPISFKNGSPKAIMKVVGIFDYTNAAKSGSVETPEQVVLKAIKREVLCIIGKKYGLPVLSIEPVEKDTVKKLVSNYEKNLRNHG